MLREDFPILSGQDFAYLDSAATMQKPQVVIDTVSDFYKTSNANPRRGLYDLSVKATEILEDARKTVANFIGAEPEQIVFTKNVTESLNLAAWLLKQRRPDAKISAPLDLHHSALLPFANLFGLDQNGEISLRSGMSNVTGEMPDFNFATVIDSAQEVVHRRIDVSKRPCDFLAFSGHKLGAEFGIGVLYIREPEKYEPVFFGGEMVDAVELNNNKITNYYSEAPAKFEAGTVNVAGALSLKIAIEYLLSHDFNKLSEHTTKLSDYAKELLEKIPEVKIYSAKNGIVSFNIEGVHPHDAAQVLASHSIMLRAGYHCAQPFLDNNGWGPVLRASFCFYNIEEEVERLAMAVKNIRKEMGLS